MSTVGAVVVDFRAGEALRACVDSLVANGLERIVVVDNDASGSAHAAVGDRARVVEPGRNLGYGAGVNRGVAALGPDADHVLVLNPDVVVHDGTVAALAHHLDENLSVGIVGPAIERPDGTTYPAHRVFPSPLLAAAHAVLGSRWPQNPFTRRYRSPRPDGTVDWVSGACFLVRREVFERVGGFDERYFMFAEDMDLCWRIQRSGSRVAALPGCAVTHVEGLSRRHASLAMVVAHHRSALRFEAATARGWRRATLPLAAALLGVRLALSVAGQVVTRRST